MKVLLASASPRRRELLKDIFSDFEVTVPDCNEKATGSPKRFVKQIAKQKAMATKSDADLIISADTIVVYKNKILGKPKSQQDAISTLTTLAGKKHLVFTGVCLKYKKTDKYFYKVFCDKSQVFMKDLSQKQIHDYLKTGSPLDKAGSYGIQDGVVEKFVGSYSNIVGLPLEKLEKILKKLNLI